MTVVAGALFAIGTGDGQGRDSGTFASPSEAPSFGFPLRVACSGICPGDRAPSWSPDGSRIAFFRARRNSDRDGQWEFDLMIMNRDASEVRRLVADVFPVAAPIWSPNGRSLLMSCSDRSRSEGRNPAWFLCTVDPAGRDASPTRITAPGEWDVPVDWSPDGGRIAFTRGTGQLWIAKPDGSGATLVGGGPGDSSSYYDAAWSRDGERLAVLSYPRMTSSSPRPQWSLSVGDAEGTGLRFVTARGEQWSTLLGWAPNGRRVYLRFSAPVFPAGVAVADTVDRRLEVLVRRAPSTFGQVALSPDGTMFGFVDGNAIMLAATDQSSVTLLTQGVSSQARSPSRTGLTTFSWSRDSNSIVYVADAECPTLLGLHKIGTGGEGGRRVTQLCAIVGTARADVLQGTEATNAIYGLTDDDRIRAARGADNIQGGPGNDTLDGGGGDDRINGGPGRDTIAGGTGWDAIVARDRQVDRIRCGPGRDIVWADDGDVVGRDCEDVVWRS